MNFALDSAAIHAAIGCGPSAAVLYGVNESTDSLYIEGKTANFGYCFNAAGDVCQYGDAGASIYVEYYARNPDDRCRSISWQHVQPEVYYGRLAFVNGNKRAEVTGCLDCTIIISNG